MPDPGAQRLLARRLWSAHSRPQAERGLPGSRQVLLWSPGRAGSSGERKEPSAHVAPRTGGLASAQFILEVAPTPEGKRVQFSQGLRGPDHHHYHLHHHHPATSGFQRLNSLTASTSFIDPRENSDPRHPQHKKSHVCILDAPTVHCTLDTRLCTEVYIMYFCTGPLPPFPCVFRAQGDRHTL